MEKFPVLSAKAQVDKYLIYTRVFGRPGIDGYPVKQLIELK